MFTHLILSMLDPESVSGGSSLSTADRPGSTGVTGVGLSSHEYAQHVPNAVWLSGIPWHLYGRLLMPLCMPHIPLEVNREEIRAAVSQNHALLACWTTDWDVYDKSEWWWVVCDQRDYQVDTIRSSRGRALIRKGLRECTVRRIEVGEFARPAYPIHQAALRSYGMAPPTFARFVDQMEALAEYSGTDFWGAFRGDVLTAFAIYQRIDGAASGIIAKSNPEFHKYQPNAAMFYTACQHYMAQGLRYVTGGERTLVHPSAIQEFSEKLGWRKVFCRVNVELSPMAKLVVGSRVLNWGTYLGLNRVVGSRWRQLEGLDKLLTIANTFTRPDAGVADSSN